MSSHCCHVQRKKTSLVHQLCRVRFLFQNCPKRPWPPAFGSKVSKIFWKVPQHHFSHYSSTVCMHCQMNWEQPTRIPSHKLRTKIHQVLHQFRVSLRSSKMKRRKTFWLWLFFEICTPLKQEVNGPNMTSFRRKMYRLCVAAEKELRTFQHWFQYFHVALHARAMNQVGSTALKERGEKLHQGDMTMKGCQMDRLKTFSICSHLSTGFQQQLRCFLMSPNCCCMQCIAANGGISFFPLDRLFQTCQLPTLWRPEQRCCRSGDVALGSNTQHKVLQVASGMRMVSEKDNITWMLHAKTKLWLLRLCWQQSTWIKLSQIGNVFCIADPPSFDTFCQPQPSLFVVVKILTWIVYSHWKDGPSSKAIHQLR